MTGLIKATADDPERVRPLPPRARPEATPIPVDPFAAERAVLESKIRRLTSEVAALRADMAKQPDIMERVRLDALEAGRAEGRAMADDLQARRLDLLRAALGEQLEAQRQSFDRIERFGSGLALIALEKMFSDADDRVPRVANALRRQLDALESSCVIEVVVSPADFPDASALQDLAEELKLDPDRLRAGDELPAGACRIRQSLGELDVGPELQWAKLKAALLSLCDQGEGE